MDNQPVILYVEDDPTSRDVMELILGKVMGIDTYVVWSDSTDFETRIQQLSPNPTIIFLDIHLQPYDGFTMLKMLRANSKYADSKIIALTASVMNEEIHNLRQAGFDGAIGKPIQMQSFPDLIQKIQDNETVWHIV